VIQNAHEYADGHDLCSRIDDFNREQRRAQFDGTQMSPTEPLITDQPKTSP
jgi:hypothetical protein